MSRGREAVQLLIGAIDDAIKEAGNSGIPSGHLYTMLCGLIPSMSLDSYEKIISILEQAGKIRVSGHLLTASKGA